MEEHKKSSRLTMHKIKLLIMSKIWLAYLSHLEMSKAIFLSKLTPQQGDQFHLTISLQIRYRPSPQTSWVQLGQCMDDQMAYSPNSKYRQQTNRLVNLKMKRNVREHYVKIK